jgi:hypothetical protein
MYQCPMLMEPLNYLFVNLLAKKMICPYVISLLSFHQLRMLFSLDLLLFFEYLPPPNLNHLHVSVLHIQAFFHLLRFHQFLRMILTHQTLSILVILLPHLSQLQIPVYVFLWILTVLGSEHFNLLLKFDLIDIFHQLCHLLLILH